MTGNGRIPSPDGYQDASGSDFENVLASYLDRLTEGDFLDPEEVRAANPQFGEALLEHLATFIEATEAKVPAPLGTLGDYTLRRQIGRGGMGVVYEAWENSMDRVVALKVLPPGAAADNKAFTRFMREAKTAGQLRHENIVGVYSTGVKEGTPWYSMEYVEGETLAEILARLKDAEPNGETPFGKKDTLVYFGKLAEAFADVADGLQHAHSKKVIHRDIKPSNLILDRDGRLRILDFGLARLEGQESLTLSGDFVGTPAYMSPEQARRRKIPVDHRTDVYSLGATMYETFCGQPPFRGTDHAETLTQIIERDPEEPRKIDSRVPKDLETIVLKCLRKEAVDRYGTAEALGQDLRRFVRRDFIEARPPGAWDVFVRRVFRYRRMLLAAAGIATLLLVCAALAWRLRIERETAMLYLAQDYETRVVAASMKLLRAEWVLATGGLVGSGREYLLPRRYQDLLTGTGRLAAEEAVDQLTVAIKDLPDRFEGYYYRASGRKRLGDDQGAMEDFRECLARNPSFVPAHSSRSSKESLTRGRHAPVRWPRAGPIAGAAHGSARIAPWSEKPGKQPPQRTASFLPSRSR